MAKRPSTQRQAERENGSIDDTALRSMSKEDRAHLCMDAWEPSLLRKLLHAQNKLRRRRER